MMMRRRNYLIKKDYQLSFASKFLALLLLEAVLIGGLFFFLSGNTLTTGYMDSVLKIDTTSRYFFMPLVLILLIAAIGIGMAGLVVFTALSHRIAGPLFRFEKTLEGLSSGDLTQRISLRKKDQLRLLKESINDLAGTFDRRMAKSKALLAELTQLASAKDAAQHTPRIRELAELLKEEIGRFKVTSGQGL